MKAKDVVMNRLKSTLLDDKMASCESLSRLIKAEIMNAISCYAEIDPVNSSIEFEFSGTGAIIDAKIHIKAIKRLGAHII